LVEIPETSYIRRYEALLFGPIVVPDTMDQGKSLK